MKAIEKIDLTVNEISRLAHIIDNVNNAYLWTIDKSESEQSKKIAQTAIDKNNEVLEDIRLKLRDVLENIAKYGNGCDMWTPIDMAVSEVSFQIIYDRVKAGDFE